MRITIYFSLILALCSCKTQHIFNNNNDIKIIDNVIERKKLSSYSFLKETLNKSLTNDLSNSLHFEDEKYHEFGSLRSIFSNTIIDNVFNKKQTNHLIEQLKSEKQWDKSNLEKINVVSKATQKETYFRLSNPVYTLNKQFAMIKYSVVNHYYQTGNSGILLYKKEKENWIFINGFFNTME